MARQTAFPGVLVESLSVSGSAPPDGGFIQSDVSNPNRDSILEEAVDRGLTRDFEVLQRAAQFYGDTVADFIQDAEDMVGPFMDSFELTYNLKVRAAPEVLDTVGLGRAERVVAMRARAFVRAKNPFEPEVINVGDVTLDNSLSGDSIGDVYNVSVKVTK